MARLATALIFSLLLIGCMPTSNLKPKLKNGWYEVNADKFYTFYLPLTLPLTRSTTNPEAEWGSTYSNDQITLSAEYSSYSEEINAEYADKQSEYKKEITTIDGRRAKIQSWKLEDANWGHDYKYCASLILYEQKTGKQVAKMNLLSKQREGIALANEIFKTVRFQ